MYINFLGGSGTIANNNLNGQTTRGKTAGIEVVLLPGGTPGKLTIKNNQVNKNANRGIVISGAQYNVIEISGNYSSDNKGAAIVLYANVNRVYVKDNIALDSRDISSKTQTYGLQFSGAVTIGKLVNAGNDFTENATAEYDYGTAIITTDMTRDNP